MTITQPMKIDQQEILRRLEYVDFGEADARRLRAIAPLVRAMVDEATRVFFDSLLLHSPDNRLVQDQRQLDAARQIKRAHLLAMVGGHYGIDYVEDRLHLGRIYAGAGIEPAVFLGAYQAFIAAVGRRLMQHDPADAPRAFESFLSFRKLAFFELSLIVDVLVFDREQVIQMQQQAIRELSIPILRIREHLLMLPLIGTLDPQRMTQLSDRLLEAIRDSRARVVVMNVTGVPVVDVDAGNSLLRVIAAGELLGARTILTGMSEEVCHTMVRLGVDLRKLNAVGDLQHGLEEADRLLNHR
jgi:rsbT co-antagonist protein RsbR